MERHELLAALHVGVRPRNYLEIGVGTGLSLALSRVPSIGVDPAPNIQTTIRSDTQIVHGTSDRFFARADPLRFLRGGRNPLRNVRRHRPPFGRLLGRGTVDLAFIDGLHLFEFALRDFMNVERHSTVTTVIVLDDMLPRNVEEASRKRTTRDWTGDVYKLVGVLREYRPDLLVIPVDTQPTGVVVILSPDHTNTVLHDHYDAIVAANLLPDPQDVPAAVLERVGAVAAEALLDSPGWDALVRSRRRHLPESRVRTTLVREFTPLIAAAGRSTSLESVRP